MHRAPGLAAQVHPFLYKRALRTWARTGLGNRWGAEESQQREATWKYTLVQKRSQSQLPAWRSRPARRP
eukprot:3881112-Pyramimonas_sp.AAC.1